MMFEYILRPERVIQPKEEAIVDAEIVAHQDFDLKDHRIQELEERMRKAREILEEHRNAHAVGWKYGKALSDWCEKRDAWLNALKGK